MRSITKIISAALICGLGAGCASLFAPTEIATSIETAETERYEALAIPETWPSVRIAVKADSGPVAVYVDGFADISAGRAASPDDLFPIASITKALTAITVLQMIEAGQLHDDDKVADLLPEGMLAGVPHADALTVKHLLDHSSGLYAPNNNLDYLSRWIGTEFTPAFNPGTGYFLDFARSADYPPEHAPGDGRAYSDLNYLLLGDIVEQVIGETFEAVVRAQVLAPLELSDTYFVSEGAPTPQHKTRLVRGYLATSPALESFLTLSDLFAEAAPGLLDTSAAYAALPSASGMVSSLGDLTTLFDAVLNQDFLAPAERARFIRALTRLQTGEPATVQDITTAVDTAHGPLLRFAGDGAGVAVAVFWDQPSGTVITAHTNVYGHFDEHDVMAREIAVPLLKRDTVE